MKLELDLQSPYAANGLPRQDLPTVKCWRGMGRSGRMDFCTCILKKKSG